MKRKWFLAIVLTGLLLSFTSTQLSAKDYNYMKPEDLKSKLDYDEAVNILDIQVQEEFSKHHIKKALSTCAYPVKSMEEQAKLDKAIDHFKGSDAPIVIVCPRGAGGAERTYDYLKEKGIAEDRIFILEKGQAGWPYEDSVESKNNLSSLK